MVDWLNTYRLFCIDFFQIRVDDADQPRRSPGGSARNIQAGAELEAAAGNFFKDPRIGKGVHDIEYLIEGSRLHGDRWTIGMHFILE